jgi:hypothetical protein
LWTDKNRAKYNRDRLRYPSDLTDDEWAHVELLIPPARRGGKRRTDMRAAMNGPPVAVEQHGEDHLPQVRAVILAAALLAQRLAAGALEVEGSWCP